MRSIEKGLLGCDFMPKTAAGGTKELSIPLGVAKSSIGAKTCQTHFSRPGKAKLTAITSCWLVNFEYLKQKRDEVSLLDKMLTGDAYAKKARLVYKSRWTVISVADVIVTNRMFDYQTRVISNCSE